MDDKSQRTAHLVGVCGAGMKSLAELLLDLGWSVSGSDLQLPNASVKKLIARDLVFHQGHRRDNLPDSAECLVYSPAVPASNPERREALRRQLPQNSYSQMVAQLMRGSTGVCIAGTHGKSTTTAMTATILESAGRLSAAVIGAELCGHAHGGWSGSGDLFVVESCEFRRSFLDFHPRYACLLSVEHDHFDCYPEFASLETAFRDFAELVHDDGVLLVNDDCPVSRNVSSNAKRVSFGFHTSADWVATALQATREGSQFTLTHQGGNVVDIELRVHGQHNVSNALAAAALCAEIGIAPQTIRDSLARFQGIRRRLEFMDSVRGVTFVDDYAHHPTAVKVTLQALRSVVGGRRIVCIFQPHQIGRTLALMDDFAASFDCANEAWISPVFAARESAGNEPCQLAEELARRVSANGIVARSFASLDQIVTTLEDATGPEDVVVTMGAGDIDRIYHDFTRRVQ